MKFHIYKEQSDRRRYFARCMCPKAPHPISVLYKDPGSGQNMSMNKFMNLVFRNIRKMDENFRAPKNASESESMFDTIYDHSRSTLDN